MELTPRLTGAPNNGPIHLWLAPTLLSIGVSNWSTADPVLER